MLAEFHFLRPFWLLLLLAVPLVGLALRHVRLGDSGWSRFIPARLLTPVLQREGRSGRQPGASPAIPAMLAITLLTLALAGPAWREAPTPLKQPGDSLVIALDLSLSMLATDVEPDRLTRAKRKIRDILAAREGGLTGLLVFAGDAHVVTPLTDDSRTIEGMLNVLDPVIMPATGNRADLAVLRARELLAQGAPGTGRILLITDSVGDRYRAPIRKALADSPFTLSTLVVGTEEGGPIPLARRGFIRENGEIVISRAEPAQLAELARNTGGQSHELTLDNADINALELSPQSQEDWQESEDGLTVSRWQDDGYWLLWLALPLILLGWRRGALTVLALALLPALPRPAQAISWDELWQREDQLGPALIQSNPERAARLLDDPSWRGSALYRSQQYDQAAEAFAQAQGPQASYNRGNALARAGKLEQALEAYDKALAQAPDLEDARHNRKLVEDLLRQKNQGKNNSPSDSQQNQSGNNSRPDNSGQSQQNQNSQDQGNQNPGNETSDTQGQRNEGQDTQGQGKQGEDGDSSPEEPQGEREPRGEPSGEAGTENGENQAPAQISETPLTQSQEQWLRRVPDNPGGLLQRKFLQQYQQRQTPSDEGDTPW
ncbi:VWA domain-containing protein [Marinobacter sp.]|uniref:VWA domain-containing protein n=1 Tax=Marinobacter sp. TaxID=50741 RepID=UPI0035C73CF2